MSKRLGAYWIAQLIGWTLFTVVGVTLYRSATPLTGKFTLYCLCSTLSGLVFTHLYRRELKRRDWLRLPPLQLLPRLLSGGFLTAASAWGVMFLLTLYPFRYNTLEKVTAAITLGTLFNWTIIIYFWTVLYMAVYYFRNFRRVELQKLQFEALASDAQLRALRSQINPHFLFNSLNSLRALIVEEPSKAQRMVTQLSSILRYSLNADRCETVPLAEEIRTVRDYLDLESIRFEERLRIRIDTDSQAGAALLPPMLLQNLVENAVKHGVAKLPKGGEVAIEASVSAGMLRITVMNSGQLGGDSGTSTGVGIINTRERLRLLHGDRAAFTLRNEGPSHVMAEVTMPYCVKPKEEYAGVDRR